MDGRAKEEVWCEDPEKERWGGIRRGGRGVGVDMKFAYALVFDEKEEAGGYPLLGAISTRQWRVC